MHVIKTSEKLLIWMHRNNITQTKLATDMDTYRQEIAEKIKTNTFDVSDMMKLKRLGFDL